MGSFGRGYILLKLNEIIKSQILIIDYQHADELHNFLIKPLIYQPKYLTKSIFIIIESNYYMFTKWVQLLYGSRNFMFQVWKMANP